MKKAYLLIVLFLCGLSVENLFAAAADDLGLELIYAARAGDEAEVRSLIAAGADVNAAGPIGSTALMDAAYKGNEGMVKLLLSHGADKNIQNHYEDTAEDIARSAKHINLANYIQEYQPRRLIKAAGKR